MKLELARPLSDPDLQAHHELALAVRASDDPPTPDAGWGRGRIFVSIASFRDPECQHTIKDLFDKAEQPERITVGLIAQTDAVLDQAHFEVPAPRPRQVRELRFDWRGSRGVCWARFLGQSLWRGEEVFVQIDSHMRFAEGWDRLVIEDLADCPSEKAILAQCPPPYLMPGAILTDAHPGVIRTDGFLEDGSIRFTGIWPTNALDEHHLMPFLMAGALIAPGRLVQDCCYDPYGSFETEEISYALRAFTHGWDVFTPRHRTVWHQYQRNNTVKRGALEGEALQQARYLRALRAANRFNHLTGHAKVTDEESLRDVELFGLGSARRLGEFEDFAGLDFRGKRASEHALRAHFLEDLREFLDFPVPVIDDPKSVKPALMSESERLLRKVLRDWETERLAAEFALLLVALKASQDGGAPGAGDERIAALKADFLGWEREALVCELARLIWTAAQVNAAEEAAQVA